MTFCSRTARASTACHAEKPCYRLLSVDRTQASLIARCRSSKSSGESGIGACIKSKWVSGSIAVIVVASFARVCVTGIVLRRAHTKFADPTALDALNLC